MSNSGSRNLKKIDTSKLADSLEKSGFANYERRRALCIEIGVDFNQLDFGQHAPHDFAIELIDHLKRNDASEILSKLSQVIGNRGINIPNTGSSIKLSFLKAIPTSAIVTFLVFLFQILGVLQFFELRAFDFLMRLRSPEEKDNYVSVIGITGDDIRIPGENTIPDNELLELIEKINDSENVKPLVIGLDIYRDKPTGVKGDHSKLVEYMKKNNNVVATCLVNPKSKNSPGSKPPYPEIPEANLGFSDVVIDYDDVIRRHLLFLPWQDSDCKTEFSLSFQLAYKYLESLDPPIEPDPAIEKSFKIRNTIFKDLGRRVGAYQKPNQQFTFDAFQIFLNYRSSNSISPPFSFPLPFDYYSKAEFMSGTYDLNGRVVLIGYTSLNPDENQDLYSTPYGYYGDKKMPGVFIHAHMVSQILNAVLEDRPLLSVWPTGWALKLIYIFFWSLIGGGIAWRYFSILRVQRLKGIIFIFLILIILVSLCWFFLGKAIWVSLVPPILALIVEVIVVLQIKPYNEQIIPYLETQVPLNKPVVRNEKFRDTSKID